MSTSAEARDKTVTGYPAQSSQVASGYPAASAYPYAAPQPLPVQPYIIHHPRPGPTYYDQNRYNYRSSGPTFLCRLIMAVIVVFSIMGLVSFITWLVLRPRLPEFQVVSASVPQLNSTRSELTATWLVSLLIKNPNHKLTTTYDSLQAWVVYGDDFQLGSTQLAPFSQDKGKESTINFQVGVVSEYVGEDVISAINSQLARGSVDFGVKVYALVRFRAGFWRMREHLMRVYCYPLKIGFSSSNRTGTLVGQSRQCKHIETKIQPSEETQTTNFKAFLYYYKLKSQGPAC